MALFSPKKDFFALHQSLGLLKQTIEDQHKTLGDIRGTQLMQQGRADDTHMDLKIFLTEKEERHEKHIGELALSLTKHLDEALELLRALNEAAAVEKAQSAEILRLLNEALDKQRTDVTELQRKVVILQARKA